MPTIKIVKTKPKAVSGWRPWGSAKTATEAKYLAKYAYARRDIKIVKFPKGVEHPDRPYIIYLKARE